MELSQFAFYASISKSSTTENMNVKELRVNESEAQLHQLY